MKRNDIKSDFEKMADSLESGIMEQMQRNYSHTVIDHAMNPRNIGKIEGAEGHARFTGPCGDIMEIFLRIQNNVITEVSFMTDGCGTSLASGSMVTELVKRKHIQAAYRINQKNVLEALGGLPEEDEHCALLAASTMKLAVQDYLSTRNHLWKRMYKPGERS